MVPTLKIWTVLYRFNFFYFQLVWHIMKHYAFFCVLTPPIRACLRRDIRYTHKAGVKKRTCGFEADPRAIA